MPLTLQGEVRGVETRTMNGPTGPFESITIHVLDGIQIHRVQPSRDFKTVDLPKEGDKVTYEVAVSSFRRKDGTAGVQITALRPVNAGGARVAAVS